MYYRKRGPLPLNEGFIESFNKTLRRQLGEDQDLNESLDSKPLKWKLRDADNKRSFYEFYIDGVEVSVFIDNEGRGRWSLSYTVDGHYSPETEFSTRDALKMLSTLVDIIKHFVENRNPEVIEFFTEFEIRHRLYMRMVKKYLPNAKVDVEYESGETHVTISNLKEEKISESKMDKVDKSEVKGKFKKRDDKDIDNDGDVDDEDEYLHNRRKAISKAIKKDKKEDVSEKVEVDHSRYLRSHDKKAKGNGNWAFTSKEFGDPDQDEMVFVNGDLSSAGKEAAKKLGTDRVYVMESAFSKDLTNFEMFASTFSDGAHAYFTDRLGVKRKLSRDDNKQFYVDGEKVSRDEVKRMVRNQTLNSKQGMYEAVVTEAKMDDKEVLKAAKSLAQNGKDAETKKFGKGLVDYYEKNGSFTPDQVSGLQNIMKNAGFQFAKESLDEASSQGSFNISNDIVTKQLDRNAIMRMRPTLIGTVAGIRFYEHPIKGDESPLIADVPNGDFGISHFWEVPTLPDLVEENELTEAKQPSWKISFKGKGGTTVKGKTEKQAVERAMKNLKIDGKAEDYVNPKNPKTKKMAKEMSIEKLEQ